MARGFQRISVLVCLGFGLVFSSVADLYAAKAPVSAFGRLPHHDDLQISPDGRYLAALRENGGRYVVVIYDLLDLSKPPYAVGTDKAEASWVRWVSPTRLVVSLTFPSRRYGTPTTERRLVAMNFDGSEQKEMVKQRREEIKIQMKDRVVDFLPDDPNAILMAYNKDDPSRLRVYRVDVNTGRGRMVQSSIADVSQWLCDLQGRVRIGLGFDDGTSFVIASDANSEEWRRIWQAPQLSTSVFEPILFKGDGNTLYVKSNHEGGTAGIYEFDLTQQKFTKKIFKHPDVDTDGVLLDTTGKRVTGVEFVSDGPKVFWLDTKAERNHRSVTSALGSGAGIVSETKDGSKAIIVAGSATEPRSYYLLDWKKNNMDRIAFSYPELDKVKLSEPIAVMYQARDGLDINAYLTLPSDRSMESAENLPTIIMPHGGPTARDFLRFDYEVQFLANRGYAVFQMNFRGSSGYGAEFQEAGYGEWGQAIQNDVTDGTRWLIDQGIADLDRICISGSSFGGYAALMGPVREPDLYACAASLNGATDLRALMRSRRNFVNGKYEFAIIGDYSDDRAELRAYSPVLRADEINIPVLLVHGTDDRSVPFNQSQKMASALGRAGKEYKFVKLEDGDHFLSNGEHRVTFLRELESFLAANLN